MTGEHHFTVYLYPHWIPGGPRGHEVTHTAARALTPTPHQRQRPLRIEISNRPGPEIPKETNKVDVKRHFLSLAVTAGDNIAQAHSQFVSAVQRCLRDTPRMTGDVLVLVVSLTGGRDDGITNANFSKAGVMFLCRCCSHYVLPP